jgi:hypothetical protein
MSLLDKVKEPPKIRVIVRKRPLNAKEGAAQDVVEINDEKSLTVAEIK